MKNTTFKKSLSVIMAVFMLMSCWVWVPGMHNHISAANITANVTTSFTLSPEGNRGATDWTRLALTGEGSSGGTSVVLFRFSNAELKKLSDSNKIDLKFYAYSCPDRLTHKSGTNVNADIYYITKNQTYVSNQGTNKNANVGDSNHSVLGSSYGGTNVQNSAKSYFGLSDSTKVGEFVQPDINGNDSANRTGAANVTCDVTDIVKSKAASGEDLSFIVMLRSAYSCSSSAGWSDIYMNSDTITLSGYTGAYGMPEVGLGNKLDGSITTNVSNRTVTVKYPTKMYLDISEDLSDVGYSINVSCNTNNKMIVYPAVWGGQESDKNSNFENDRANYDANLDGQNTIIDAFDKYGIQKTGPGYFDNETIESEFTTCLIHNNASNELSNGANYALQGKPKAVGEYRYYLVGNSSINPRLTYVQTGGTTNKNDSGYISGNVDFTITVYDKSALNITVNNKTLADSESVKYTDASWNAYKSALNNAKTILSTRETTQSAINSAESNLVSKYDALELKEFTVTFNTLGGNTISAYTFKYGQELGYYGNYLPIPTKAGYTFDGWYADNNGNGQRDSSEEVTYASGELLDYLKVYPIIQDWTIYPHWIANRYNVLYDNLIDFSKWDTTAASHGTITDITQNGFTLTYNNDGAGEGTSTSPYFPVEVGKQYRVDADIIGDAWDVYIFFYDDNTQSGLGIEFADGADRRYSSDSTWEPVFTAPAGATRAVIRLDANGSNNAVRFENIRVYEEGKVADGLTSYDLGKEVTYGEGYGSLPTPTREGYTFAGWVNENGDSVDASKSVNIAKNHTLYSTWTVNKYTVTFKKVGGTTTSAQYDYGTAASAVAKPANTAAVKDAYNHTVYTWPAINDVTDNVTYEEIATTSPHDFGEWITETASTCTSEGAKYRTCKTCGYREDSTIEKASHTLVHVNSKAPTCTVDGNIEYWYCSVCSVKFSDENGTSEITNITDAAKGHTEEIIPAVPATCTTPGKTEGKKCSVCDTVIVAPQDTELAAHTEKTLPAVAPTCTATGLTEGKQCTVCGTITVAQTEVPATGHSYTSRVTAPTCTEQGYTTHTCSGCGDEYVDSYVDAKGHTETTREENIVNATCGTDGSYELVTYCSVCKVVIKTEAKTIPATGEHTLGDYIIDKEATCTAGGSKHKECSVCGYKTAAEEIPATGHNMAAGEVVAPTCTEEGYTVYSCTNEDCDYSENRDKTNALNHSWSPIYTMESNGKDGKHYQICTRENCGAKTDSEAHNWSPGVLNPDSTCEAPGVKTYTCEAHNCGATYTEEVPTKGHTYGNLIAEVPATCIAEGTKAHYTCSVCKKNFDENKIELESLSIAVNANNHASTETYIKGDSVGNCGVDGYTGDEYYSCCKTLKKKGEVIPATGNHSYGEVSHDNGKSTHSKVCSVCNYVFTENCTASEWIIDVYATCMEKGSQHKECTVCDFVMESKEIPTVEHNFGGDAVKKETGKHYYQCQNTLNTGNQCTEFGNEESCSGGTATCIETATCEKCNEKYGRVNSDNHAGDTYTKDEDIVAGTCITEKTWNEVTYCSDCNAELGTVEKTGEKDAANHDIESHEAKEPTCTEPGWDAYETCKREGCNYSTKIEKEALKHNYVAVVTPPDCTDKGYTTHTCSRCGDKYVDSYVDELGHTNATREENRVPASCGADGSYDLVTYCSVCKVVIKTEAKTIPATGEHNYETEVVGTREPATCKVAGSVTMKCGCGATEIRTLAIDKENHVNIVTDAAVESTCFDTGLTEGSHCGDCGKVIIAQTETAKKAHTLAEAVEENRKEATCYAEGSYDEVVYCSVEACKHEISRTEKTIEKIAHTPAEAVIENNVNPTCETDGSYDKVIYCSVCKAAGEPAELSREKVTVPAINHKYTSEITTYPTCTEPGVETFTCENDNSHTYTKTIDPLNHIDVSPVDGKCDREGCNEDICEHNDVTKTARVEAECEKNGNIQYWTCNTCKKLFSDEECQNMIAAESVVIPAINHAWTVSYSFAENGKSCTATRICGNDASHNITATAEITSVVKEKATCTEMGTTTYTAKFTENWAEEKTKDVKDIPAINHAWTVSYSFAENGKSCIATRICGNDASHNITATAEITSVVKEKATCTEMGTTTYTAKFTENWAEEKTKDVKDIPAINHAWTVSYSFAEDGKSCTATRICGNDASHNITATAEISSSVKEKATCTEMGTTTYTAKFTENWAEEKTKDVKDIPATGIHSYTVYVKTVAPTCTEQGYDEYKCATCTLTEQRNFKPAAHKEETLSAVEATCSATGLTEGKKCSVCGTVTVAQNEVKKLPHTEATRKDNVKDATCGEDGSYDLVTYCSVCSEVIKSEAQTIPATGEHTLGDYIIDKEATCTADGSKHKECSVCGYKTEAEIIPATGGHNYSSSVTTAPTCKAPGVRTYTCSKCNDSYTEEIEALKHNLVQVSAKEPTSTEPGWYAYEYCTNCDYTTKVIRPAVGGDVEHEFVWSPQARTEVKDSTCSEEGYTRYYCSCSEDCKAAYIEEAIPKKEHIYKHKIVAPTCVNGGETIYICKECGYGYTAEYTAPLGHNYSETVIAPTCENQGYTKYDCTSCTETFIGNIVDEKGHLDSDGNGLCDDCDTDVVGACSCLCHSTNWLLKIIYKIIRFIWKLLGSSPVCGCGVIHY